MTKFEWDPKKSLWNKQKHGVSFFEALEIWRGIHLSVEDIAHSPNDEKRSATIGTISGKIYTVIWTKRKNVYRIISVRRARNGEKDAFTQEIQK